MIPAMYPVQRSLLLLTLLFTLPALPAVPAEIAAAKDHTIFVGVEVAVERKGKFYRVIGAEKNALQIMHNHQLTLIPLVEAKNLRIDRGVKLSNLRANITNLRGDPGASRQRQAIDNETFRNSMAVQDEMEDRRDKVLGEAVWTAVLSQRTDGSRTPPNTAEDVSAKVLAQLPELTKNIELASRIGTDLVTSRSGPEGGLSDTGFVVSFDVSAPAPLVQCHLAVIADYTLPGNSNLTLSSVTLEPIANLGPVPQQISCEVRRFPPGATVKGYRVALYSHGQEIATNLSSRRTDITREETVLYLTLEHLARHPGETLPPTPVLMIPRSDFVIRLGSTPLDQVIFARVGKDGKIIRLSSDATGWVRLTPELDRAVDQVAFVPALEKGKPVEGVAKIKLADLVASN